MSDLPQTRQSLLIRLKDRSDDAWPEFLDIYERSIVGYVRRKGLQEADAQDVAQEVLAAVDNKVQSWVHDSAKGKFRGWLFRVARNIAIDKIVELKKRPLTGGTNVAALLAGQSGENPDDSNEFWQDYRRQLMHWAAAKVKPQVTDASWQAFRMTALDGVGAEQVAQLLGMTRANVYAAKFRVTARIQKLVAKFDNPDEWSSVDFSGLESQ